MKVKVEITEVLQKTIEVEANSLEEALTIVKEKYNNCEIILDDSSFIDKEFKWLNNYVIY